MFIFCYFSPEMSSLGKFRLKHQNWLFKQKLGIEIASNIVNPVALIILTYLTENAVFGANLVKKKRLSV